MEERDFMQVIIKAAQLIDFGVKKEYLKIEDKIELYDKLDKVFKKGIKNDIPGNAIFGYYSTESKDLHFNPKVFKNEMEALIYALHEMKHALDDFEDKLGFEDEITREGVGINEGATQRFATDIAEEILERKIEPTFQKSLGITVLTNLDEYQLEDRMTELFCKAIGISRAEFLRMQNSQDTQEFDEIKRKFNEHASFDIFLKALDGIYSIQTETWFDENGNFLEKEKEATPEQTARAKELIRKCQDQILKFVEKSNPDKLEYIKGELIMIDGEIMNRQDMLYQEDYLTYQNFITTELNLSDYNLVYVSGLREFPFEKIYEGIITIKETLEISKEPLNGTIYLRQGDEYKMATVTFNKTGVIEMSEIQDVTAFDEIIEDIEHSEIIGNAEEYIRILQLQGNDIEAQNVQRKYEYFINNRDRIPELKQQLNGKPKQHEFDEIRKKIELAKLNSASIIEDVDEGAICYNGIDFYSSGIVLNYSNLVLTAESLDEKIKIIEQAIESGELELTEIQKNTLLKIKQKLQDLKIIEDNNNNLLESAVEATKQSTTIEDITTQKRTITQEQEKNLDTSEHPPHQ